MADLLALPGRPGAEHRGRPHRRRSTVSERPSIRDLWPDPPANLVQRLEHFMDQWRNVPDDYVILYTTIGVYDQPTGILMGDIRTLYGRERLGVDTVVYGSAADVTHEHSCGLIIDPD